MDISLTFDIHYSKQTALEYTSQERLRSREHARSSLLSSVAFTILALILALVLIPLLSSWLYK